MIDFVVCEFYIDRNLKWYFVELVHETGARL